MILRSMFWNNFLLVGFVIFSIFGFIEGIRIILDLPINIATGMISVVTTTLVFNYLFKRKGEHSGINIIKNSLLWKIKKNKFLALISTIFLWILAAGNYIYAFSVGISSVGKGVQFIFGLVLSLIALMLVYKNK